MFTVSNLGQNFTRKAITSFVMDKPFVHIGRKSTYSLLILGIVFILISTQMVNILIDTDTQIIIINKNIIKNTLRFPKMFGHI